MTSFSVLVAFGAVLGLIWVVYESPPRDQQQSLNAGILVLVSALIGGRTAYVAVHWTYFQDQIIEALQVWLGGLAWPGALAGGILGTFIAAGLSKTPVGVLADRLLPLLASLAAVIWLGCWMAGCAYGAEVNLGLPTKDEWGAIKNRIPLQILSAITTLLLFWGIGKFGHRKKKLPPGLAASFGLGGLSLILLIAALLRADPYPMYRGLRLETWAALIFLAVSILFGGLAILSDYRNKVNQRLRTKAE